MNLFKKLLNHLSGEWDYWTLQISTHVCSEFPVVGWPDSFLMETNNPYKGVLSTIDCAGVRARKNKVDISGEDPFIVKSTWSDAVFAVYGRAILQEDIVVEWMGEKILDHCGWITMFSTTKARHLTKKEKEKYAKSSNI